jgi:hypothetical protein
MAAAGQLLGSDGAAEGADDHGQSEAEGGPTCGVSSYLGGTRNVDPASRVAQIAELGGDVGERPEQGAAADQVECQPGRGP